MQCRNRLSENGLIVGDPITQPAKVTQLLRDDRALEAGGLKDRAKRSPEVVEERPNTELQNPKFSSAIICCGWRLCRRGEASARPSPRQLLLVLISQYGGVMEPRCANA